MLPAENCLNRLASHGVIQKIALAQFFLRHGVCTCVFFRVQVVCQDYQASRYKTQYMSFLRIYTICIKPSINKII